ncbi:hypothetical protein GCM10009839_52280 [Catenulispora yoronensis]|uniref:HTH luxR-type domain-containing protein n=1 Tax=Catenulispora yoronensis TaxID=450799 RepID=A0ABN2UU86_9ACTN
MTRAGQQLPLALRNSLSMLETLTDREMTVLRMLAVGMDNRAMAWHLRIREATVKRHMTTLLAKLGLTSRLQAGLVAFAVCLDGTLTWYEGAPESAPYHIGVRLTPRATPG